jgi:multiple sugar transport system substrate-binding protein
VSGRDTISLSWSSRFSVFVRSTGFSLGCPRKQRSNLKLPIFPAAFAALSVFAITGCNRDETGKTNVTLMTFEWSIGKDNYRARERLFNAQSPDIHLTILYTSYATYITKLLASFAGNIAPDLFYSMTGRDRLFISRGVFQPLNKFIDGPDGIDLRDFNQTLIKEQLTRDGKIYALPQTNNTLALYYSKDLFRKAGIPPLSETEPITWDEYREIAVKLTHDTDGDGETDQFGCAPGFDGVQPSYFFYVLNASFGCTAYNKEGTAANFDSQETIDAFYYLHSLIHEFKCAPTPDVAQQAGAFAFPANRMGMLINGPWVGYDLQQTAPDFEFGVAPLPYRKGYPRKNMIGGTAVGISSQTKNPEAAWKVLKFLLSPEFEKLPIQGLPSRLSLMNEPDFNGLPYWKVFRRETEFATTEFFVERYDEILTIVRQTAERLLGDPAAKPRIPEALREMNRKINALLQGG